MAPAQPLETVLQAVDNALRAVFAPARAARTLPDLPTGTPMDEPARRHAAGLMRVNHAGEIAAQALYHGQALLAREGATREFMLRAAAEEGDHLAWCEQRLGELGARRSVLGPLWYAGSFAIGAAAAALSDALSLGFVAETERQVASHLEAHLSALPSEDARSRHIVATMQREEAGHAAAALAAGGAQLPPLARGVMKLASQVMTRTAYWL
jgi:ubiquinone biosynthesis monooxygenase Coq7